MPSGMKKQPVVSQRGYRDNVLGRCTKSARSAHYAHRASARQDPVFVATRYKLGFSDFFESPMPPLSVSDILARARERVKLMNLPYSIVLLLAEAHALIE